MYKVSENTDLSKKVLDIDIASPIFNGMLDSINEEIQRCIDKVYDKEFEAGEITLKLSIEIPEVYKEYQKINEYGNGKSEYYQYRKPKFEYNVTTNLKKQYKQKGAYEEEREVKFEDGKYIATPVQQAQINIYELEGVKGDKQYE